LKSIPSISVRQLIALLPPFSGCEKQFVGFGIYVQAAEAFDVEFISPLLHIVAVASEIVAEVSTASLCNHLVDWLCV